MIETELLLLRPITRNDNQQVFSYRSDAETNKYTPTETGTWLWLLIMGAKNKAKT